MLPAIQKMLVSPTDFSTRPVGRALWEESLALSKIHSSIRADEWNFCPLGFIRIREMSGKFKFFQGQGTVREFYVVSVKNRFLLKCQGNFREFYNFQFVSSDEKQKITSLRAVFLTFWIQAKSF